MIGDSDADTIPLPKIEQTANGYRFVLDGAPAILLGGQLHNSTSTDVELPSVLERVAALGASVVVGTASWDLIEPAEGRFDFDPVDRLIAAARDSGLRLVLIWFGAFKNAASTYAPGWVRHDVARFPRSAVHAAGTAAFFYPGAMPKPVLSVFSAALREADATAFAALMRHLARTDAQHTVVMVQIENEVGLLGDTRDRSLDAERAWLGQVPMVLSERLGRPAGTWADVFGDGPDAHEIFMAWAFASYVEELARRGRSEKDLPMYVNAWLGPQPGQDLPGQYPSGGPASRVLDVWKVAAPSVDGLSPDVYVADAKAGITPYVRPDNPVFVPESRVLVGNLLWSLGAGALGFSIFGVDDLSPTSRFAAALQLLRGATDMIADAQAQGRLRGVLLEGDGSASFELRGLQITAHDSRALMSRMLLDIGVEVPPPPNDLPSETVRGAWTSPADTRACGLVLADDACTFTVIGQNLALDFSADDAIVELDSVEAGDFRDGRWRTTRVINGDERLTLVPPHGLGAARIRLLIREGRTST
jgi:hypothetical protein